MPALIDAIHEKIAQGLAQGLSQFKATVAAGRSVSAANRLCNRLDVIARVQELNPDLVPSHFVGGRGYKRSRRTTTAADLVECLMGLATEARKAGNYAAANVAYKNAIEQMAQRDGKRSPKPAPKPTKEQRNQRVRDLEDVEDIPDDRTTDNVRTPDISEISDMAGGFDDGPGDRVEEEQVEAALAATESSIRKTDRDE